MSRSERIASSVLELVGKTPLVRLNRLGVPGGAELVAKVERVNPGGSSKDRIALSMVEAAEREGRLVPGMTLVEPTSGNTGIGLALVAAVKGYRCVVVMPDDMSLARRRTLTRLGAEVVLTSALDGMGGAIAEAEQLARREGAVILGQFQNPANPQAHYRTTGPEIWEDCGGKLDALVCGVGTGGTLSGAGRFLREQGAQLLLVAVEPDRPLHQLQGLGAGFDPPTLARELVDRTLRVSDEEGLGMADRAARLEGLFVGPSSGAALVGALRVAEGLPPAARVVVVLPDGGERYVL